MTKASGRFAVLFSMLLSPQATLAEPVPVYFEFTVDAIVQDDASLFAPVDIAVGNTYRGAFVYDDASTNLNTNSGNFDVWDYASVSVDGLGGIFTPAAITAIDGIPASGDEWELQAFWDQLPLGFLWLRATGEFDYEQTTGGTGIYVGPGLGHAIVVPPAGLAEFTGEITYTDGSGPGGAQNFGAATLTAVLSFDPLPVVVFDNFDMGGGFGQFNIVAADFIPGSVFEPESSSRSAAQFPVVGNNFRLTSVTLPINLPFGAGDNLRVRIAEDDAGVPGRTLEVLSENETIWPSESPLVSLTTLGSTTNPMLLEGAAYWIVIEVTTEELCDYRWHFNLLSSATTLFKQQQSGAGLPVDPWPVTSVQLPVAFAVDGIVVPAPAPEEVPMPPWFLLLLAAGLLGWQFRAAGRSRQCGR